MYLSQFQEMNAHVSLCKSVDSPEPLLPVYTKYRSIKTAGSTASAWTTNAGFRQYVMVPKSHMLVKSSF